VDDGKRQNKISPLFFRILKWKSGDQFPDNFLKNMPQMYEYFFKKDQIVFMYHRIRKTNYLHN